MRRTRATLRTQARRAARRPKALSVTAGVLLLAFTLLATSGCAERAQPLPQLTDETGAVLEYQFHVTPEASLLVSHEEIEAKGTGAIVVDPPADWDARIAWPARPCQQAPAMRVTGTSTQVTGVHVDYGPQLGPGECPDALVIYGVDLKTSRPLAADLSVTGSGD